MSEQLHTVTIAALTGCASADGLSDRGNKMSLQTYDKLPEFLEKHGHELIEGAWVVDLTPLANQDGLFSMVWKAPLVDVELPAGDIHRWQGSDEMGFAPMIAASYFGEAGRQAAMTTTVDEPGPYDYVSPDRWAEYWHDRGALVGRYIDGKVVWG